MYKTEVTDRTTGERFYVDKNDTKYVSTTTLIGYYEDKSGITKWQNRIGLEEANRIRDEAALRGTRVHSYVENYLKKKLGDGVEEDIASSIFNNEISDKVLELGERTIKSFYQKVIPVSLEEVVFFSDASTRFAGRYDQLVYVPKDTFTFAESFDSVPEGYALVDLKTKNTMPRFDIADYLVKYCIQGSAYVQALKEIKGVPVKGLILVFVTSKKCRMVYLEFERLQFYWNYFYSMLLDYYKITPMKESWADIVVKANATYDYTIADFKHHIPHEIS